MPTDKRYGIVVKNYFPAKFALSLLDNKAGKMLGVSHSIEKLAAGCLISYTIDRKQNPLFLYDIQMKDSPLQVAQEDILFLHHLLEICYYFIPLGTEASPVFNLLQLLYRPGQWLQSRILKKIYVMKLFASMGIYPEESTLSKKALELFSLHSFATIIEKNINTSEDEIDVWLNLCLNSHPHREKFKTVHFLENT